eukprot:6206874-Pleurochrysis_carterae.AAC.3
MSFSGRRRCSRGAPLLTFGNVTRLTPSQASMLFSALIDDCLDAKQASRYSLTPSASVSPLISNAPAVRPTSFK